MKPVLKLSAIAASLFLVIGCQDKVESETPAVEPAVEQVVEQVEIQPAEQVAEQAGDFASEDAKAAYALGASLGQFLAVNLERQAEFGIDMSADDIMQGVEDALAGNSKMTDEEMQAALSELEVRAQQAAMALQAKQAEENIALGEAFRTAFAEEEGTEVTESGLMYQVETMGEGAKPTADDVVEVHYVGTLIDGTEFDSSYSRQQTVSFPLNGVIRGWTEGLQLMPVGSKFKFVIPPELAYGAQNMPTIPANSTLVFEVELIQIQPKVAAEEAPAAQTEQ
uniref:FKBP-type peptidyl-prolyl cis-trans isomerase n=1 Tax=Thaumasiovibrio occultus TaxID=1891184 RepID=UPI000B34B4D7|nr:FKBP-type peptidyl-prolyl cis-trans isomerase [Thaumasiovibrio occultus]